MRSTAVAALGDKTAAGACWTPFSQAETAGSSCRSSGDAPIPSPTSPRVGTGASAERRDARAAATRGEERTRADRSTRARGRRPTTRRRAADYRRDGQILEGAAADGADIYFFQELAEAASRAHGRLVIVGILAPGLRAICEPPRPRGARRMGQNSRTLSDVPLSRASTRLSICWVVRSSPMPHTSRAWVRRVALAQFDPFPPPGHAAGSGRPPGQLLAAAPGHGGRAGTDVPTEVRPKRAQRVWLSCFGRARRLSGFLARDAADGHANCLVLTGSGTISASIWSLRSWRRTTAIAGHRARMRSSAAKRAVSALHVRLAKSIALIDMFRNGSGLAADRATLAAACPIASESAIDSALGRFRALVRCRLPEASGCLVDLCRQRLRYRRRRRCGARPSLRTLDLARLARLVGLHPVLAKRHYHETGSLRWFQTELVAFSGLGSNRRPRPAMPPGISSWQSRIRRMRTKAALTNCRAASETAEQTTHRRWSSAQCLAGPRSGSELIALEAVRASRPELDGDSVARREIAARIAAVSAELDEELRAGFANADWYVAGERVELPPGASLSRLASDLADQRYSKGSPRSQRTRQSPKALQQYASRRSRL